MQNFWQRAQNYLVSFLTPLLLHKIHASQAKFVEASGRSFRLHETGVSSAAAVVAVVDWALEYPQPVPPRLHVCLFTVFPSRMHVYTSVDSVLCTVIQCACHLEGSLAFHLADRLWPCW